MCAVTVVGCAFGALKANRLSRRGRRHSRPTAGLERPTGQRPLTALLRPAAGLGRAAVRSAVGALFGRQHL